ncbi:hypothetical protein ACOMHN_017942 [Nucella lapillus]
MAVTALFDVLHEGDGARGDDGPCPLPASGAPRTHHASAHTPPASSPDTPPHSGSSSPSLPLSAIPASHGLHPVNGHDLETTDLHVDPVDAEKRTSESVSSQDLPQSSCAATTIHTSSTSVATDDQACSSVTSGKECSSMTSGQSSRRPDSAVPCPEQCPSLPFLHTHVTLAHCVPHEGLTTFLPMAHPPLTAPLASAPPPASPSRPLQAATARDSRHTPTSEEESCERRGTSGDSRVEPAASGESREKSGASQEIHENASEKGHAKPETSEESRRQNPDVSDHSHQQPGALEISRQPERSDDNMEGKSGSLENLHGSAEALGISIAEPGSSDGAAETDRLIPSSSTALSSSSPSTQVDLLGGLELDQLEQCHGRWLKDQGVWEGEVAGAEYRCSSCDADFPSMAPLLLHQMEQGHSELEQTSGAPGQAFSSREAPHEHLTALHPGAGRAGVGGVAQWRCALCPVVLKDQPALQVHGAFHQVRELGKCAVCSQRCPTIHALKAHLLNHHAGLGEAGVQGLLKRVTEQLTALVTDPGCKDLVAQVCSTLPPVQQGPDCVQHSAGGEENGADNPTAQAGSAATPQQAVVTKAHCDTPGGSISGRSEVQSTVTGKEEAALRDKAPAEPWTTSQGPQPTAPDHQQSTADPHAWRDQRAAEDALNADCVALDRYKDRSRPFKCHPCKMAFTAKHYLLVHRKLSHKIPESALAYYAMEKYQDPNRPYKCNLCQMAFIKRHGFVIHLNSVGHLRKAKEHSRKSSEADVSTPPSVGATDPMSQTSPVSAPLALAVLTTPVGTSVAPRVLPREGPQPGLCGSAAVCGEVASRPQHQCDVCRVSFMLNTDLETHFRSVAHQRQVVQLHTHAVTNSQSATNTEGSSAVDTRPPSIHKDVSPAIHMDGHAAQGLCQVLQVAGVGHVEVLTDVVWSQQQPAHNAQSLVNILHLLPQSMAQLPGSELGPVLLTTAPVSTPSHPGVSSASPPQSAGSCSAVREKDVASPASSVCESNAEGLEMKATECREQTARSEHEETEGAEEAVSWDGIKLEPEEDDNIPADLNKKSKMFKEQFVNPRLKQNMTDTLCNCADVKKEIISDELISTNMKQKFESVEHAVDSKPKAEDMSSEMPSAKVCNCAEVKMETVAEFDSVSTVVDEKPQVSVEQCLDSKPQLEDMETEISATQLSGSADVKCNCADEKQNCAEVKKEFVDDGTRKSKASGESVTDSKLLLENRCTELPEEYVADSKPDLDKHCTKLPKQNVTDSKPPLENRCTEAPEEPVHSRPLLEQQQQPDEDDVDSKPQLEEQATELRLADLGPCAEVTQQAIDDVDSISSDVSQKSKAAEEQGVHSKPQAEDKARELPLPDCIAVKMEPTDGVESVSVGAPSTGASPSRPVMKSEMSTNTTEPPLPSSTKSSDYPSNPLLAASMPLNIMPPRGFMGRFKPHLQRNLLENFGFECVMHFHENAQSKRKRREKDRKRKRADSQGKNLDGATRPAEPSEQGEQPCGKDAAEIKAEVPEINKSVCEDCGHEFSSVFVLKAHGEEVHRRRISSEVLEDLWVQVRAHLESKWPRVEAATPVSMPSESCLPVSHTPILPVIKSLTTTTSTSTMTPSPVADKRGSKTCKEDMPPPPPRVQQLPAGCDLSQMMPVLNLMSLGLPSSLSPLMPSGDLPPTLDSRLQSPQHTVQRATAAHSDKRRTRIKEEQLKILRSHFDINTWPTEAQLGQMAETCGLPYKVVKHWFRNTLFKERQRNKDSPYNFNIPPSTTIDLEQYEKTGKIPATVVKMEVDDANTDFIPDRTGDRRESQLQTETCPSLQAPASSLLVPTHSLQTPAHSLQAPAQPLQAPAHSLQAPAHSLQTAPHLQELRRCVQERQLKQERRGEGGSPREDTTWPHKSSPAAGQARSAVSPSGPLPCSAASLLDAQAIVLAREAAAAAHNAATKRANRTRFSDIQVKLLQEYFEQNAYPKDEELERLSKALGLNPRVIVVWFQNARQKVRKGSDTQPSTETKESGSGVPIQKSPTSSLSNHCSNCGAVFYRQFELLKHQRHCCMSENNNNNNKKPLLAFSDEDTFPSCASLDDIGLPHSLNLSVHNQTHTVSPSLANSQTHTSSSPLANNHRNRASPSPDDNQRTRTFQTQKPTPLLVPTVTCQKCELTFSDGEQLADHYMMHHVTPDLGHPLTPAFSVLQSLASQDRHQLSQSVSPSTSSPTPTQDTTPTRSPSTPQPLMAVSGMKHKLEGADCDPGDDQPRDKRLRTTILPEQLDKLQSHYQQDSNPSRRQLEALAQEVGLTKRVVQVWFQNTRARERKGQPRTVQPLIHHRCPFCSALFRARAALESHLAHKHPAEMAVGDVSIDALSDADPDPPQAVPSHSGTSPCGQTPAADVSSLLTSPSGTSYLSFLPPSTLPLTFPPTLPPLDSVQLSMQHLYEDAFHRYITELSASTPPPGLPLNTSHTTDPLSLPLTTPDPLPFPLTTPVSHSKVPTKPAPALSASCTTEVEDAPLDLSMSVKASPRPSPHSSGPSSTTNVFQSGPNRSRGATSLTSAKERQRSRSPQERCPSQSSSHRQSSSRPDKPSAHSKPRDSTYLSVKNTVTAKGAFVPHRAPASLKDQGGAEEDLSVRNAVSVRGPCVPHRAPSSLKDQGGTEGDLSRSSLQDDVLSEGQSELSDGVSQGDLGSGPSSPKSGSSAGSAQKRHRTQMSAVQVKVMRLLFTDYRTPSMAQCELVGQYIGLAKRVVQVWFQNARAKDKKFKQTMCKPPREELDYPRTGQECLLCGVAFSHKVTLQDHIFTRLHINRLKGYIRSHADPERDAGEGGGGVQPLGQEGEGKAWGKVPPSSSSSLSPLQVTQLQQGLNAAALGLPTALSGVGSPFNLGSLPAVSEVSCSKQQNKDCPAKKDRKKDTAAPSSSGCKGGGSSSSSKGGSSSSKGGSSSGSGQKEPRPKQSQPKPPPPLPSGQQVSDLAQMMALGGYMSGLDPAYMGYMYPTLPAFYPGLTPMPLLQPALLPGAAEYLMTPDPLTFGTPLPLLQIPPQAIKAVTEQLQDPQCVRTYYTQDCRSTAQLKGSLEPQDVACVQESSLDVGFICRKCHMVYPSRDGCRAHQRLLCQPGGQGGEGGIVKLEQRQWRCGKCEGHSFSTVAEVKAHCLKESHRARVSKFMTSGSLSRSTLASLMPTPKPAITSTSSSGVKSSSSQVLSMSSSPLSSQAVSMSSLLSQAVSRPFFSPQIPAQTVSNPAPPRSAPATSSLSSVTPGPSRVSPTAQDSPSAAGPAVSLDDVGPCGPSDSGLTVRTGDVW